MRVWSDAKHVLEWLFWAGLVASTHRRGSFERVYDLPERVLPRSVLARPTPDPVDARRELVARSARALGVGTANDLRDYYRLSPADARLAIEELVEDRGGRRRDRILARHAHPQLACRINRRVKVRAEGSLARNVAPMMRRDAEP